LVDNGHKIGQEFCFENLLGFDKVIAISSWSTFWDIMYIRRCNLLFGVYDALLPEQHRSASAVLAETPFIEKGEI